VVSGELVGRVLVAGGDEGGGGSAKSMREALATRPPRVLSAWVPDVAAWVIAGRKFSV